MSNHAILSILLFLTALGAVALMKRRRAREPIAIPHRERLRLPERQSGPH